RRSHRGLSPDFSAATRSLTRGLRLRRSGRQEYGRGCRCLYLANRTFSNWEVSDMSIVNFAWRRAVLGAVVLIVGLVTAISAAASGSQSSLVAYNLYPLVSDGQGVAAPLADSSLVNGWGLSASPTSPWWTSNNRTNSANLYSGGGSKNPLTVSVAGGPTGTVANTDTTAFVLAQNGVSSSARFLFATQAGQILGWSPGVNAANAIPAVDNSSAGARYDGLATLNGRLYATDFHNARVDVFDASFRPVALINGFRDSTIPKGWAPFGIQALGGEIFVTYAQ